MGGHEELAGVEVGRFNSVVGMYVGEGEGGRVKSVEFIMVELIVVGWFVAIEVGGKECLYSLHVGKGEGLNAMVGVSVGSSVSWFREGKLKNSSVGIAVGALVGTKEGETDEIVGVEVG